MRIIQNPIGHSIGKSGSINPVNPLNSKNNTDFIPFDQILKDKIASNEQIKFSKHASMRLNSRNIVLTDEQMAKIKNGIEKAEKKGIKDSLVLMDEIALVVNVKKRIVVTAMDSNQTEDAVFTNIDGAVIV